MCKRVAVFVQLLLFNINLNIIAAPDVSMQFIYLSVILVNHNFDWDNGHEMFTCFQIYIVGVISS